jgi:hypothetical protein
MKRQERGNFPLSYAASRRSHTAHLITQSQKLHSQLLGLMTAVMHRVTGLTCSFFYGMGRKPASIIHNLASDANRLLFFHVRPAKKSTIPGVDLCHKKCGRTSFTETRVFRHQTFVSVHNTAFHSECYTVHKRHPQNMVK